MRNLVRARLCAVILAVALPCTAYANTTPHTLSLGSLAQSWSELGLITANNNWSGVPGIVGYRGDGLTATTGVDPRTVLADGSATPVDVNANQTNPNTFTTGGVAEFEIANPTIALNGSGTAGAPHIVIFLDTTGRTGIRVSYNLRDLDGSVDNAISPVALQYRVGNSGNFINVPAGYVPDASTGPSLATLVTAVDTTLPAEADNQPLVQVRIITTNAAGNDEWIGIDDIVIASASASDAPIVGTCPSSFSVTVGVGGSAAVSASDADDAVVNASISAGALSGITMSFTASTGPGMPLLGTLSVASSVPIGSYPLVLTFANADAPPQTATCALTVTVIPTAVTTRIRDIQGASHRSPLNGVNVQFIPGVVTAVSSNGFYMEDWAPDANPATSEGIFVFTNTTPLVSFGQTVLVTGTVDEFRAGANVNNLTVTQISSVTGIFLAPTQQTLPPAVVIGSGGRVPPTQTIYTGAGNVETTGTFDPAVDGVDFYESLEGMRVRINSAVVVGPTNTFGETWVLADEGANAGLRTTRGGIVIRPGDFNPERIQIDDTLIANSGPTANVGDFFQSLVGIMNYDFSNYEVLLTAAPLLISRTNAPEITTLVGEPDRLTVASYNVENLDPIDGAAKFDALAAQIVGNLRAPDIIAAIEVQDNNGATNNGVVDAATTLQTLVNAIAAVGGPTYQWRQINPVDGQDGGEPGGNIRVAFLYNPARVSFVDRPGGTPTAAVGVVNASGVPQLTFSPGRIDPLNVAFNSSRKPLAGEFLFRGNRLFVIANHFNSKGGDQPLFGPTQPPVLSSEGPRNQQATIVRNFVQQILAIDAGANVVVLGDLNDFEFSSPLTILKSASLTPLLETLPPEERYSYVFEGNSQALDHIMVSSALLNASAEYDVVHMNAEYANQTSDHDPEVARFFLPLRDLEDSVDLNGDGKIDCADLAIIKSPSFLKRNGQPGFDPRADVNKDGIVDMKDWALVFQRVPAATWAQCR